MAPQPVTATDLTPGPLVDLTLNMLGPVEIFRDPARPFAADAWTTRRARDILCFIVSRRHHRAPKDTIIDMFWTEDNIETIEKNFHPTVSHIRKALNSNQPLKQNFIIYRDGDYQLNPEFSYRIDTDTLERLIADGETARRERRLCALHRLLRAGRGVVSRRVHAGNVTSPGSMSSVRITASSTCECWNRWPPWPKRKRNGRARWIWRSASCTRTSSARTSIAC